LPALFATLRAALDGVGMRNDLASSIGTQRLLLALLDAAHEGGRPPVDAPLLQGLIDDATATMTVADRARRLGVSPQTLNDAVHAATGLAPHDYVVELRMARAQALLVDSALDVKAISRDVGYEDSAYFSRLFARRVGMPPTRFRQQQSRFGHPLAASNNERGSTNANASD
jgi:AraC-like DNA-binding protein